jgi:hypothetical protein
MSLDERIKHIALQAIEENSAIPDSAVHAVSQVFARLDDLHAELHAIATRVTTLEKQTDPEPGNAGQSAPAPPPSPARKAPAVKVIVTPPTVRCATSA